MKIKKTADETGGTNENEIKNRFEKFVFFII